MKKLNHFTGSFAIILALVGMSFTQLSAQDYLPKDLALTNLVNENLALYESLPGLEHTSDQYLKTVEKIRVIKNLASYLKVGKTVSEAVDLTLPGFGSPVKWYIKKFPDSTGKMSTKWATEEILPLVTL